MPRAFRRSIFQRISALAILLLATNAQADQPNATLVQKINQDGFFGSTPYNKYVAHDLRVASDGHFAGLLEWEAQKSIVSVVGTLSATTISFRDTGYVKKGSAKIGCEFSLTIDDQSIGAEGTYQGCGGSADVRKAWVVFGTREQDKARRDAQNEQDDAQHEAQNRVADAQFAVAAADYVTKNCPTLRVDWQQVEKVVAVRGWTIENARQAKYYAQNLVDWTKVASKPNLKPDQDVCYQLKVLFLPPLIQPDQEDMMRMITSRN